MYVMVRTEVYANCMCPWIDLGVEGRRLRIRQKHQLVVCKGIIII